ncbi:hypothetical protein EJ02DRAFT_392147 [Clathrospora elynae]|uniref:GST N-terminal domain-containing protein n=1 Tax=Clathrospora elynae TaxID=706981 RepID=A0A6A5T3I3_9PLEO|nr:hypothetical protein EJ02DRAFT_392147 [Clathrospora elynae]
MAPAEKPVLFHYPSSIYSHRVLWYLWLRGIAYDECIQPPIMPRPDLASIDVGYHKIPLMAIGKDVYCDSRFIISKLDTLYPNSQLAPSTPAEAGIRKLFENWTIDGGIFGNAVKLIPYWIDSGILQNEVLLDDLQTLMGGRRFTAEMMEAGRPDGLQALRQAFDMLENTFLIDGRDWILGTNQPTLADIDAVWPFEWLLMDRAMTGSLPEANFGEKTYPKVHAWVRRFMAQVQRKKKEAVKATALDGETMASRTLGASSSPENVVFINDDPLSLKQGDEVEVFPSDYRNMGKSAGALMGLTTTELVIRNKKGLHLHFPRWNFSAKKVGHASTISTSVTLANKIPRMRLLYHPGSPFVRKVFMLAHELGLAKHITLQKVVICPVPIAGWSDNNAEVAVYNPMAKIPCLISDDVPDGIFDSRIICEYLTNLAGVSPKKDTRYWQLYTLHACADGIMDAVILIIYEVRIRKERGLYFDEWVEGQKQKILRVLDRLEVAAKDHILPDPADGPASADEVAVVVAISVSAQIKFPDIEWSKGRPNLVEWMEKWEDRASCVNTPPGKDWVVGTEEESVFKI